MYSNKKVKNLIWFVFILYVSLMLILLFDRGQVDIRQDYWDKLKLNINLMPFHTISHYLSLLINKTNPYLVSHAIINLIGNIVMFIPLGFLLPCLIAKLKSSIYLIIFTVAVITAIELIQLFTLQGSFDVDDIILNVAGAWIGLIMLKCVESIAAQKSIRRK